MLWLVLPLFKLYKQVICGFRSQSINPGVGGGGFEWKEAQDVT